MFTHNQMRTVDNQFSRSPNREKVYVPDSVCLIHSHGTLNLKLVLQRSKASGEFSLTVTAGAAPSIFQGQSPKACSGSTMQAMALTVFSRDSRSCPTSMATAAVLTG